MSLTDPRPRPRSRLELFVTFTLLALQGFGGVLAIVQRVLCEQKRWLTREEFVETLAVAQVLPGPNVCNVSMMIGDRFFGLSGALAALAGMLVLPGAVVLALAAAQAQFAGLPAVQGALRGVAGVTAGMVIGSALKLAPALRKNPLGASTSLAIGGAAFAAIALLRLPLVWTLLALGGASVAYALFKLKRRNGDATQDPTSRP